MRHGEVKINRLREFNYWRVKLAVDYYFKPWYPSTLLLLDAWFNSKHFDRNGDCVQLQEQTNRKHQ